MTYRELQKTLKQLKAEGKTTVKLNSKFAVLQAEYDRIKSEPATETTSKKSEPSSKMSYREIQAALRHKRDVQKVTMLCKLNAKYDVLQAEYNRLYSHTTKQQQQPETTTLVCIQQNTKTHEEFQNTIEQEVDVKDDAEIIQAAVYEVARKRGYCDAEAKQLANIAAYGTPKQKKAIVVRFI